MKIIAIDNINWDTTEANLEYLPKSVKIQVSDDFVEQDDDNLMEDLSDYLSYTYHFCVFGFSYEVLPATKVTLTDITWPIHNIQELRPDSFSFYTDKNLDDMKIGEVGDYIHDVLIETFGEDCFSYKINTELED